MASVILDRFNTGVTLAMQLLTMKIYCVCTITTNRLGFWRKSVREATLEHEEVKRTAFQIALPIDLPSMLAFGWVGTKPAHFLSTVTAASSATICRNRRDEVDAVPFPKCVVDTS